MPKRSNAEMDSARVERCVLGSVLLRNSLWREASVLCESQFSLSAHRTIFRSMRDLAESNRPIDEATLSGEFGRHNELQNVGGAAYITELTDGLVERPSIADFVAEVQQSALLRLARKTGEDIQSALTPRAASEIASHLVAEVNNVGEAPLPPRFSETALAMRFSAEHVDDLRYVNMWGKWMGWDGCRWSEDATLHVWAKVRDICCAASQECVDNDVKQREAIRLTSAQTVTAVEKLARCDRRQAATIEQWDANLWELNTPGGIVDLLTGGLRAATPEDYCTKIAGSAPGGECPRWVEFLDRVTGGNLELQQFLQRMVGYCLTGSTREHSLFFFYGTGANGKSVFLNTIGELLGDYSKVAPVASFTATTTEQHPTDLAGLRGARFVSAIETEDGRWWAEAKIKSLTGGDKITARFMRQDFFEYVPQFKLIVAGNHKPGLRNVDEALRRRLHLVPFVVTIPEGERDPQLCEKLRTEFPGILQWAIEGCLAWQRDGLSAPEIVKNATADYLAGEDAIARWLDERCVVDSKCWSSSTALYTDFKGWCQEAGERERTLKAFTQALEDRKFKRERTRAAKGFSNIGLKADTVPDVPRQPHIPVTRARAYTSYIGGPGTCGTDEVAQ